MTLKQISTLLNNAIIKNEIGEGTTINEDLSNLVDLGTIIDDLDATTLTNFQNDLAVGIAKNYFEGRALGITDYGLYRDAQEFGGAVQRIKISMDNFDASDSAIYTQEDGTDYFDGAYAGIDLSAKVYTKETIFKVKWSIPNERFKQMFKSADEVGNYVSLIEQTIDNKVTYMRNKLAKRVVNEIMEQALADNRKINLVTLYNARHDAASQVTTQNCLNSPEFLRWAIMIVNLTADRMKEVNKKYNDGSIETFMQDGDIRITLLSEFDKAVKVIMQSDTYHADMVDMGRKYSTSPYWQNSSNEIVPTLGKTAELKVGSGAGTTYSNVVGVVYDYYSGGITQKLNKVTNQYIGAADYTNFYLHVDDRYFVDTRNSAVVFTLN